MSVIIDIDLETKVLTKWQEIWVNLDSNLSVE